MTPIKILINVLDDERIWQDLIISQLSGNYDILAYTTFSDFIAHFTPSVDLVIMDVRLKDGTDVADRIKSIYDISPNCYIIIVSAFLDVPLLQELIRLRVNDTVQKGSNWISELGDAVNALSDKLQARSEMKGSFK